MRKNLGKNKTGVILALVAVFAVAILLPGSIAYGNSTPPPSVIWFTFEHQITPTPTMQGVQLLACTAASFGIGLVIVHAMLQLPNRIKATPIPPPPTPEISVPFNTATPVPTDVTGFNPLTYLQVRILDVESRTATPS